MTDQKHSSGSASWADRFFGPLYGELYRTHLLEPERTRREADFAAEVLGLRSRRVLDLAAGFGRHARLLAQKNDVVALDLNHGYLRTALRGLRGTARRRLAAVRSDMRRLPFAPSTFDSVLFLFNSFGYFSAAPENRPAEPPPPRQQLWKLPEIFYQRQLVPQDFGLQRLPAGGPAPRAARQPSGSAETASRPDPDSDPNLVVLKEIQRVLRPGGTLLMEIPNPRPLIEAVRTEPRRHLITARYEIQEEYSYDPATRILRNRTRFRLGRREEDGEYALRLYERAELADALRRCGLTPVRTYGDYEGTPYSASRSDSILIHARRRA